METDTLSKRILLEIKQPRMILIFVVLIGVLTNLLILVLSTMPLLLERGELKQQLQDKQTELQQLVAQPPVVQVTDEEVGQLIQRVPYEPNGVQLLHTFHDYARDAGVILTDYKHIVNQGATDTLEQVIEELSNAGQAAVEEAAAAFTVNTFDLNIAGELPNLMKFIEFVKETDQVLDTVRWTIAQGDANISFSYEELNTANEPLFIMNISIDAYFIPTYATLFLLNEPKVGTSLEEALRSFRERYPNAEQFESVKGNK